MLDTKPHNSEIAERISRLKKERRAVILAHNYQLPEIQDIGDFVGDSLALARKAADSDAEVIVFCGVHFMAESAAILSPEKTVLLPEPMAGCPMADMVEPEALRAKKAQHPDAAVVCYVNSSAEVKAESDICCTSSNAIKVVESVPNDEILFIPDQNLGHYVSTKVSKKIILWEGYCRTHHRVSADDLEKARRAYPDAPVAVHPECQPSVVELADFVGSTSEILSYARKSGHKRMIIGTEMGIMHQLKKDSPDKQFFLLTPGLVCPNMKMTRLEKVLSVLENMNNKITVAEDVRARAHQALERMIRIG